MLKYCTKDAWKDSTTINLAMHGRAEWQCHHISRLPTTAQSCFSQVSDAVEAMAGVSSVAAGTHAKLKYAQVHKKAEYLGKIDNVAVVS